MKIICVRCQKEYRVKKAGVYLVETAGRNQRPYKLWSTDLLHCPICNHEVVTGFTDRPVAMDWQAERMANLIAKAKESGWLYYNHEFPT